MTGSLSEKRESLSDTASQQKDVEVGQTPQPGGAEEEFPHWTRVAVVMLALYLALFVISLDRIILATAVPQMTDEFHSIGDIGWYTSGYLITATAFQLFFGRIYTFYSPKWTFIVSVAIFEVGSLLCALAPTSRAFIVGRAIAGLGSAGIFSGVIVLMLNIVPLHKRPLYQGLLGAIFLISSIVGPLIGGAFTTHVTWRWCFYINLPIGAVTIAVLFFFFQNEKPPRKAALTFREKVWELDPIGTLVFLPSMICLLLALQWGGSTYAWSSATIIALFVVFAVLLIVFCAIQVWMGEKATVPPRILKYRSILSTTFFVFCASGSMTIVTYYVPIWFQAIENVDAIESGIRSLPTLVGVVITSIGGGILVTKIGYYTPLIIGSSILMSVGAGLLTTWTVSTTEGQWIGYQALFGLGTGLGLQTSGLAAQTVLSKADVPTGVSLKFFGQNLGGAVFVAVAQNVFSTRLVTGLAAVPGFDASSVVSVGATELRTYVPPQYLDTTLVTYNYAIIGTMVVATALAAISIIGAVLTEFRSVKQGKQGPPGGQAPQSVGEAEKK